MLARFRLALVGLLLASSAFAQSKLGPRATPAPDPLYEAVEPKFKEQVAKVLKSPTVTTRYAEGAFPAHATVYAWMLEHPDRVSLAWQRVQVPCVEIAELGNGSFRWTDEQGSELTWQAVGKAVDGVVWYATGKVKAATLLPMVPVRAVALLKFPSKPLDDAGSAAMRPEITISVQTDSRTANAVLRIVGPAAPKMAEQGAEQLLYFFSGIAKYLHKHPDQVQTILAPKAGK